MSQKYIAVEVLASQEWQDLSIEEKIFHIIARYIIKETDPGFIIIKLLFGDFDGDEGQSKLPNVDVADGEKKQKKRKRHKEGGKRKTRTKRKKKTKRKKSHRKIRRTPRKRKSKKRKTKKNKRRRKK